MPNVTAKKKKEKEEKQEMQTPENGRRKMMDADCGLRAAGGRARRFPQLKKRLLVLLLVKG